MRFIIIQTKLILAYFTIGSSVYQRNKLQEKDMTKINNYYFLRKQMPIHITTNSIKYI